MAKISNSRSKTRQKVLINSEIRKKLGITQEEFAAVLGLSRSQVALAETKRRDLNPKANTFLLQMYLQFHELETGSQSGYRSLETNLFLNEVYRKTLPEMRSKEKEYRSRIKQLSSELDSMKEAARNSEHAIIVFTTAVNKLEESDTQPGNSQVINGLKLFKQQAYDRLLSCWEPEQAKLQAKMEAAAAEARVLRRFRLKIIKAHNPFKK